MTSTGEINCWGAGGLRLCGWLFSPTHSSARNRLRTVLPIAGLLLSLPLCILLGCVSPKPFNIGQDPNDYSLSWLSFQVRFFPEGATPEKWMFSDVYWLAAGDKINVDIREMKFQLKSNSDPDLLGSCTLGRGEHADTCEGFLAHAALANSFRVKVFKSSDLTNPVFTSYTFTVLPAAPLQFTPADVRETYIVKPTIISPGGDEQDGPAGPMFTVKPVFKGTPTPLSYMMNPTSALTAKAWRFGEPRMGDKLSENFSGHLQVTQVRVSDLDTHCKIPFCVVKLGVSSCDARAEVANMCPNPFVVDLHNCTALQGDAATPAYLTSAPEKPVSWVVEFRPECGPVPPDGAKLELELTVENVRP